MRLGGEKKGVKGKEKKRGKEKEEKEGKKKRRKRKKEEGIMSMVTPIKVIRHSEPSSAIALDVRTAGKKICTIFLNFKSLLCTKNLKLNNTKVCWYHDTDSVQVYFGRRVGNTDR